MFFVDTNFSESRIPDVLSYCIDMCNNVTQIAKFSLSFNGLEFCKTVISFPRNWI